jgi:tetratricopeptide (TPR) repeat protein
MHPLATRSKKSLADTYYRQRDFRNAEAIGVDLLRNLVPYLGTQHPDVASAQTLLGNIAWRRGQYERAQGYFGANLDLWTELLGADSDGAISALRAQANVHISAHEFQAGWAKLEPLLRRLEATEPGSYETALTEESSARALTGLGRHTEAAELVDRAMVGISRQVGAGHFGLADPLLARGEVELSGGDPKRAAAACREAAERWSKLGERHPKVSWAYACVGRAELASGDNIKARRSLETALFLFDPNVDDPNNLADIEFALARAVRASDPARAQLLASQAAKRYADSPSRKPDAERVVAWREHLAASMEDRRLRP